MYLHGHPGTGVPTGMNDGAVEAGRIGNAPLVEIVGTGVLDGPKQHRGSMRRFCYKGDLCGLR